MLTAEQLIKRRERLIADYYALQGAIQVLDDLIALAGQEPKDALTIDEFAKSLGAISTEVVKNED